MIFAANLSDILVAPKKAEVIFRPDFWIDQLQRAEAALLGGLAQSLVIIILFFVARTILFRFVDGLVVPVLTRDAEKKESAGRVGRVKTLTGLLKSVVNYALIFMAAVALLQGFGIGVSGIIASAGVLGLAVGFGAQKLVKDVISGFFLLLENQYSVGDYVSVGLISGTVKELGMRTTHIRDDLGRICIIANGDITQVCNHSRGPAVAVVDIGVAPSTEIKMVEKILAMVAQELVGPGKPLESAPHLEGVVSVEAAKMTLRIKSKTAPGKRVSGEMSLRAAIIRGLQEEEIVLA